MFFTAAELHPKADPDSEPVHGEDRAKTAAAVMPSTAAAASVDEHTAMSLAAAGGKSNGSVTEQTEGGGLKAAVEKGTDPKQKQKSAPATAKPTGTTKPQASRKPRPADPAAAARTSLEVMGTLTKLLVGTGVEAKQARLSVDAVAESLTSKTATSGAEAASGRAVDAEAVLRALADLRRFKQFQLRAALEGASGIDAGMRWRRTAGWLGDDFGLRPTTIGHVRLACTRLYYLPREELQRRLDALAAAFGGGLSRSAFNGRIDKAPGALALEPERIAATSVWLRDGLGLAAAEAAAVLAAQPALLLVALPQLREGAEALRGRLQASPAELRRVVMDMPLALRRGSVNEERHEKRLQHLERVLAAYRRRKVAAAAERKADSGSRPDEGGAPAAERRGSNGKSGKSGTATFA